MTRLWKKRLLDSSMVRFGLVGLFGELLYFLLYGIFLFWTGSTSITLALAGSICILVNAYSHSRISFRVPFSRSLLFGYIQIQVIGFLLAFVGGIALDRVGTAKWGIAMVTYILWSLTSYLLTKVLYQGSTKKFKREVYR